MKIFLQITIPYIRSVLYCQRSAWPSTGILSIITQIHNWSCHLGQLISGVGNRKRTRWHTRPSDCADHPERAGWILSTAKGPDKLHEGNYRAGKPRSPIQSLTRTLTLSNGKVCWTLQPQVQAVAAAGDMENLRRNFGKYVSNSAITENVYFLPLEQLCGKLFWKISSLGTVTWHFHLLQKLFSTWILICVYYSSETASTWT